MFFLLTLFHAALLISMVMVWLRDTGGRLVITPFLLFAMLEVAFTWNYWLLFQDVEVEVTPYPIIVSMAASVCFLAGYMFFSAHTETRDKRTLSFHIREFLERPFQRSESAATVILLACLLGAGLGTGLTYYRESPPVVAGAFKVVSEGSLEKARSIVSSGRRELTKSHVFGSEYRGQGVLKSFMFVTWTYGLALSVILSFRERRIRWYLSVILFSLGGFYFIAGTGERGNFLWSLIVVLIAASYVVRLGFKRILLAGLILTLLLTALTLLLPRYQMKKTKSELIVQVVSSVLERIFHGNKINNFRIMYFLDQRKLDYTYGGEHLDLFLNAVPGIHRPPLANKIAELLGKNDTTYLTGTYLGKAYIDFGLVGVICSYLFLGWFVGMIFSRSLSGPKRVESIPFLAFIVYELGEMSVGSGVIAFASGMIPVVVVHLCSLFILALLNRGSVAGKSLATCGMPSTLHPQITGVKSS